MIPIPVLLANGELKIFARREDYEEFMRGHTEHRVASRVDYDALIAEEPSNPELYLRRGVMHLEAGDTASALSDFSSSLNFNGNNESALALRAALRFEAGDFGPAADDYGRLVELRPNDAMLLNDRAAAYQRQGKLKEALRDYEKAIETAPHLALPYIGRGNVLLGMKDRKAALAGYTEGIRNALRCPSLRVLRALVSIDIDDYPSAISDIEQARRLGMTSADLETLRGWIYHKLRQPANVVRVLMLARRMNPSDAYAAGLCGHHLMYLDRLPDARSLLEESVRLDPNNGAAHDSLAILYETLGDRGKAEEHRARSIAASANPSNHIHPVDRFPRALQPYADVLANDRVPRVTRLDRAKYQPPFVVFEGRGRRTSKKLSPLQSLAMNFAFPLFLGRGPVDPEVARHADRIRSIVPRGISFPEMESKLRRQQFWRRRYSGDTHKDLPRSRYLALAAEGSIEPNSTLLAEMNSYSRSDVTGYCVAMPGGDSGSIDIVFRGLPGEANPFRAFVEKPHYYSGLWVDTLYDLADSINDEIREAVSHDEVFKVSMPLEDVEIRLDAALDLRFPEARRWMVDFFRDPPRAESETDLAHGDWLRMNAEQYQFDLSKVRDWQSLIPVTNYDGYGGNSLTDIFAVFLRRLGCDGLLYPSARINHGVLVDSGSPISDWGWNIVDYRGTEPPQSLAMEEISGQLEKQSARHYAELDDDIFGGSFVHLGNSLMTRLSREQNFRLYCLYHGIQHPGAPPPVRNLDVRGYCWFRARYFDGGGSQNASVVCDQCERSFSVENAACEYCPGCGHHGDLPAPYPCPEFFTPHLRPLA